MSVLHLSPQSREALHDHLFYGALTVTLVTFGSGLGTTLAYLLGLEAL